MQRQQVLRFVAFLDTLLVAGTLDARRDAAASSKVEDLDTLPLLLSRDSASGAPIEALPECRVVVASLADRAATLARGAVARLAGMDSEAAKRTLYRGATIFALHATFFNRVARAAVRSGDSVLLVAAVAAAKPHYAGEYILCTHPNPTP